MKKKENLINLLRQRAVSSSPESIPTTLDVGFLSEGWVPEWDLSMLSSNRLQF